jgi:hypothetical protein
VPRACSIPATGLKMLIPSLATRRRGGAAIRLGD